jgi:hypothetical protein
MELRVSTLQSFPGLFIIQLVSQDREGSFQKIPGPFLAVSGSLPSALITDEAEMQSLLQRTTVIHIMYLHWK